MKGRTPLTKAEDDALAFPDKHWESFYKDGIGGAKNPRAYFHAWRSLNNIQADQLITSMPITQ
jgi:hypothetical protein